MTRTIILALGFSLSALALNAASKCEDAKTYLSGKDEQIKQMSEKKPSSKRAQAAAKRLKKAIAALKVETEKSSGNEKKCERLVKVVKRMLEQKASDKKGKHKGSKEKNSKLDHDGSDE